MNDREYKCLGCGRKIELMDYQKEFLQSCINPQSVEHIGEVTVELGREKLQELGRGEIFCSEK